MKGEVQSSHSVTASLKTAGQYDEELCLWSTRITRKYSTIIDILQADENSLYSSPMSDASSELKGVDGPESRSRLSGFADYLRPARQLPLSWASAILTVIFLVLTTVYASETTVAHRMRFLSTSSSNTIFILSALSWLTSLFLTATIAAAFERLQWLLVVREDGLQLTKFFSLNAGTGISGLLVLALGGGHCLPATTRLWSAARLVSIVLVPILGILIMSELFIPINLFA